MATFRILIAHDDAEVAKRYAVLALPLAQTEVALAHDFSDALHRLSRARVERAPFNLLVIPESLGGKTATDLRQCLPGLGITPSDLDILVVKGRMSDAKVQAEMHARNWDGMLASAHAAADAAAEVQPANHFAAKFTANPKLRAQVDQLLTKIANTPMPVLLNGETGTGKGMLASAIHTASSRASREFVPANLAAIPETLRSAALTGHVKGAYTGAAESKMGLIEKANGGTLFLDEIGELPIDGQVLLLQLEDKTVRRLGSTDTIKSDFRLICATHRDLRADVENERFRRDLYNRIASWVITIPPLRERPEDIRYLTDLFWKRATPQIPVRGERWDESAYATLMQQQWLGNVRELQATIDRLKVLAPHGETVTRATIENCRTDIDAAIPGLFQLKTATQRFYHFIFYPAAERIAQAIDKTEANHRFARDVYGSHAFIFGDTAKSAEKAIVEAWRHHRHECPECARRWDARPE